MEAIKVGVFGLRGEFDDISEAAQRAEELGFDSVQVGEHHGLPQMRFPAPLNFLSALAARTERIRLGTSIHLSAMNNPVRVAEEAAQVDVISNGRLLLGLGLGYWPSDFNHFGVPFNHRVSLFEEGIEVIRRAWTQRPFSFEGRRYRFNDVSVYPVPVQQPHPEIGLAGWTMAGVKRAARLGDAWITDPIQNRDGLMAMAACYQEHRDAVGGRPHVVLMREIMIAKSRKAALEEYGQGILATYRSYWRNGAFNTDWDPWARSLGSADDMTVEDAIRDRVVAGTPDDCIAQIREWTAAIGADYVQLIIPGHRDTQGTNVEALELIGREVLPGLAATA
jgi:probable F420-dependent oxidoreductase